MRGIYREFSKYRAILFINVQNNFAYVGEFIYRSFFMALLIYIFLHLWKAAYGSTGATSVNGITLSNLVWYLVITETIWMSKPQFAQKISEEVKDGTLAYTISRPCNYLLYHYSAGLGDTVLRLAINFSVGFLMAFLMVGAPAVNIASLPLLLITIALGLILDFCFESLIGLSAFLTEDITGFQLVYSKTLFILGGLNIPLDFFPSWLQHVAKLLPFNLIIYSPARLFISFSFEGWYSVLLLQVLWIAMMGSLLAFAFNAAMRRLSINGG
jgi:ABC-2 type transport system permease protein